MFSLRAAARDLSLNDGQCATGLPPEGFGRRRDDGQLFVTGCNRLTAAA
jgi:hypothetical protein